MPQDAQAYTFSSPAISSLPFDANGNIPVGAVVCPQMDPNAGVAADLGLARRIVPCIKENILTAANGVLVTITTFVSTIFYAMATLAIAFWGATMAMGKRGASLRDASALAVKLILLGLFFHGLTGGIYSGGLFGAVLDFMDEMTSMLSGYMVFSPALDCPPNTDPPLLAIWDNVDCAVNNLVGGVFTTYTLDTGILGFLTACLFSNSPVGFFIAILGFFLIVQLLYAVARSLYVYVTAYMGVAMMMMISPFFLPMMLFSVTRQYFEKWLRVTITFMLQGLFLIVYLVMMLAAFDQIVYLAPYSLTAAIAGTAATEEPDFFLIYGSIGGWLDSHPVYSEKEIGGKAITLDPSAIREALPGLGSEDTGMQGVVANQTGASATDWQSDIYGWLGVDEGNLRFFAEYIPVTGVDWDHLSHAAGAADESTYIIKLCISALMAAITAFIFKIMLDYVPYIGAGVSQMSLGMPSIAAPGEGFMAKMQSRMASGLSGAGT
jgi:hypothetical protein